MKKVLFHLTSFEQGGAERVISNLSGRLAEDGYDVVVRCNPAIAGKILVQ